MDLYCQRCGEPWEHYYVHQEMAPLERTQFLEGECCPACHGKEIEKRPFRAQLASALAEMLGDDTDGLAAEMEDAEFLLGREFWE
ncbi:hypothetical protein LCGC14_0765130 [marine sediment metagenome]|uniref:Uncharacterized protein n=1 Tax=marine sediment metagenome TaxID=412755 RepID=A0A0F9Q072_9ZZZZ